MRLTLLVVVAACGGSPGSGPSAPPPPPPPSPGTLVVPANGPVVLPADLTACLADADCTVVALGCGDETPVHRAHHAAAKRAYQAAGRVPGPIDDACGPSAEGTWDGAPGACVESRCELPLGMFAMPSAGDFTVPFSFTQCTADAECVVVANGCCDETPVNRLHASLLTRGFVQSGRRHCTVKTACGPGLDGTWNGQPARCVRHTCAMPPE